jgi:glycosyltransferase involved in cell wall biosynthesis
VRVAYFVDTPRIGGAERYVADVAAGVAGSGHEVVVVSPQSDVLDLVSGFARAVRAGSDAYAGSPSPAARARALAASAPAVGMALARTRADLVHVNNGGYPGSDLCRVATIVAAARIRRRVLGVHSVPWSRADSIPAVQAAVDRAVWASAHAVIGATEVVGEGLRRDRGMPARLYRKVPYGVREPGGQSEAEALRARLAPGGELLLGMVSGTADAQKGHAVLAEALAAAGGDARAVVVGRYPDDLDDVDGRLTLAGRVPEVGPYLHAVDAIVVPSTAYESLPLVVLEAMAAGKPVIASRLSGIPEAVVDGATGRLFEPGSVGELAALLREASADREALARLGAAGRARWEQGYSLEAMVAATLAVYEGI